MSRTLKYLRICSVAVVLALAISLGSVATASPSSAVVADKVPAARNKLVGKSIKNLKTDMQVVVTGSYKYYRKVKIDGSWKKKAFFGLKVMACKVNKKGECRSEIITGKLRSPYQPGKPVGSQTANRASTASSDLCLPGNVCAAPWNWINNGVDKVVGAVVRKVSTYVVKPCLRGGLAGFGGVASVNITSRLFFLGGLVTATKAASNFTGPYGKAIVTVAGCGLGVAHNGIKRVENLWD